MAEHHAQTVQLVNLPSVRSLPTSAWAWTDRVRTEQLSELTQSIRLLRDWHATIPETGLHHVDEGTQPKFDTSIPGVLRPEEINALNGLDGQHLQRAWLGLLIRHEQGAIRLDQREVDTGQDSAAVASAQQDLPRHRRLLAKLQRMLADLKPLPPR